MERDDLPGTITLPKQERHFANRRQCSEHLDAHLSVACTVELDALGDDKRLARLKLYDANRCDNVFELAVLAARRPVADQQVDAAQQTRTGIQKLGAWYPSQSIR